MKKTQQSRSLTGVLLGFLRSATKVGKLLLDGFGHLLFKAFGKVGGEWRRGFQPELLGKGLASTDLGDADAGCREPQAYVVEHGLESADDKGQRPIAGEFDM
ncbi:hypothetical protein [Pseudomonas paralcaligenes]|uniref:hypothetical protein n=1 Tax=Pseudomonas paralcaligenes TaxID=2772558 RepID=UPI001C7ECE58|nr:hypothetical protein [Pseudomonas paralcaligenes]HBO4355077.1 hypothetical protein [Pseudomonas aeruginosa]